MQAIRLKKGREKSLLRRHPWIFSGAVDAVEGKPRPGDTVDVLGADGRWLAHAGYSPNSQIVARAWSFAREDAVGPEFFLARVRAAVGARAALAPAVPQRACRLLHAESDGLPGVVADRYDDWISCEFLTMPAERHKRDIALALMAATGARGVWERSDSDVRAKEGLVPLAGHLTGEEPPDQVVIEEGPARLLVDIRTGHKTGYYLDQRDSRRAVMELCAGRDVLNCFSYTGGFGVMALLGGAARCTNIDTSAPALDIARANMDLNALPRERAEFLTEDVFAALRRLRDQGRTFGAIVLDPPRFVDSRANIQRGCRGYKDINLLALRLLEPGGLLFTFSCSGLMDEDLFQKVVAGAALDSGRDARIVRRFAQAPDHPVALNFPEGQYLKGFLVQVV